MGIGKRQAVDLLEPLLSRISSWFLDGLDEFNRTFSDAQKFEQGKRMRAQFVQRAVLARMRRDPAVVGNYVPRELNQLESLVLDAEEGCKYSVSVLFNLARRRPNGRLGTRPTGRNLRQTNRRGGCLEFCGIETIPIVAYWMPRDPDNILKPEVGVVGIAEEVKSGFEWTHTIYRADGKVAGDVVDAQTFLLPMTEVRLRRPVAEQPATRVGVRPEGTNQRDLGNESAASA